MNEFKSKTNISDYLIPMKSKVRQVFPVYERLTFLLLNERIQIESEYSWLCYPYESEVQSFPYLKVWSFYFYMNEFK